MSNEVVTTLVMAGFLAVIVFVGMLLNRHRS